MCGDDLIHISRFTDNCITVPQNSINVVLKSIVWNCDVPLRKPHNVEHEVMFDIVPDLVTLLSHNLEEFHTNLNKIDKTMLSEKKRWYALTWVEYDDPKKEEIKHDIEKLKNEMNSVDCEIRLLTQQFNDNSKGYFSKVENYKRQLQLLQKTEFTFVETESILEMFKQNEIG